MKELLQFIKHPVYSDKGKSLKTRYFFKLFFLLLLATIIINMVAIPIQENFNITHLKFPTSFKTVIIGLFLAPFFEEILFRALLKFNKKTVWLFALTVVILIIFEIIRPKLSVAIFLSFTLFFVMAMLLIFKVEKIHSYISKNIKFFYYFSAISFGLMHLFNFSSNIYLILLFSVFLVGPQIVAGFILGFIRLKYGLKYSILFHMAVNSQLLLMLFKLHWH